MHKKGFTLIEVTLFVALSGLLVLAVIIGTSGSISQKRFNDTVDNFTNYLEGLYSSANYVSHNSTGMTTQAVYGKLVEIYQDGGKTKIVSYTVLGDASPSGYYEGALNALYNNNPTIAADSEESYVPSWGGTITSEDNGGAGILPHDAVSLLIIRHPENGMFFTYANKNPSKFVHDGYVLKDHVITYSVGSDYNFKEEDINFCIDSNDKWAAGNERRLVRIYKGANNSSGIEQISNDKKSGLCE